MHAAPTQHGLGVACWCVHVSRPAVRVVRWGPLLDTCGISPAPSRARSATRLQVAVVTRQGPRVTRMRSRRPRTVVSRRLRIDNVSASACGVYARKLGGLILRRPSVRAAGDLTSSSALSDIGFSRTASTFLPAARWTRWARRGCCARAGRAPRCERAPCPNASPCKHDAITFALTTLEFLGAWAGLRLGPVRWKELCGNHSSCGEPMMTSRPRAWSGFRC